MKAYLAIKYFEDFRNRPVIEMIAEALISNGVEPVCVVRDVEQWGEVSFSSQELMQRSFQELDTSDFLLVEASIKGVGLGIEAGYAFARKIPIVITAKLGAEISSTLQGIAAHIIFYENSDNLIQQLSLMMDAWTRKHETKGTSKHGLSPIIEGPVRNQAAACEAILRALPDWFGIEEAIQQYVREIPHLPTFLAVVGTQVVGFLSLKNHNPTSAEVYVMGVLPDAHRQGIGGQLIEIAEQHLRRVGVEYLQVKTLGPSHPDEGYARTRDFYLAMGFCPLEEFPQIWDQHNPCLVMVKKV